MEKVEYRVSANLDQLEKHTPKLVPLFTSVNEQNKNRVYAVFDDLKEASAVYYKLTEKKMVAFRNWIL